MSFNDRTNDLDNPVRQADTVARNAALRALRDRGVSRPEALLADCPPARVLAWCRWWDGQRDVGTGLLAERIMSGEQPPVKPRRMLDEQRAYGDQIRDWITRHFPDLQTPDGVHPAAVAAVIRLHHRHGKGALTVREHAGEIRQAVRDWTARFGDPYATERAA